MPWDLTLSLANQASLSMQEKYYPSNHTRHTIKLKTNKKI